ncbi:hypothetical protein ACFL1X_06605 [Candidatus Hydrogenedentota bacterium]
MKGDPVTVNCADTSTFLTGNPDSIQPFATLPLQVSAEAFKIMEEGYTTYVALKVGLGNVVLLPFNTRDLRSSIGENRSLQESVRSRVLETAKFSMSASWNAPSVVPASASIHHLAVPYIGIVVLAALILGPLCTVVLW